MIKILFDSDSAPYDRARRAEASQCKRAIRVPCSSYMHVFQVCRESGEPREPSLTQGEQENYKSGFEPITFLLSGLERTLSPTNFRVFTCSCSTSVFQAVLQESAHACVRLSSLTQLFFFLRAAMLQSLMGDKVFPSNDKSHWKEKLQI